MRHPETSLIDNRISVNRRQAGAKSESSQRKVEFSRVMEADSGEVCGNGDSGRDRGLAGMDESEVSGDVEDVCVARYE